jgi:hypothetical protein
MKPQRLPVIVVAVLFAITTLSMVVVSWYIVGDQTDWSTFSGGDCELGTCGPSDFDLSSLDYTIEPWHVSAHTDLIVNRVAIVLLIIGAIAIVGLTVVRKIVWYVPFQLALACGCAFLTGALLRSATMAAVGAIIFGGFDVILMVIIIAFTTFVCWSIHVAARPKHAAPDTQPYEG